MGRAERCATAVSLLVVGWVALTLLIWGWFPASGVLIAAFLGSAPVFRWVRLSRIEQRRLHDRRAR